MSINVTVNGNPICVRRMRMVLSDMEQIKKNERDRRKRLRLEQVRQQSKEISCKLLERAKNRAKKELNKLESSGKSVMTKMHERKILDIQRKYQEDMEDIGMAHEAATQHPDVDAVIEAERLDNRTRAAERGKEAMQRLKDAAQREDPVVVQQERLRQVREVENVRSAMVAKLPSKNTPKDTEATSESSQDEEITVEVLDLRVSPKKRKYRKIFGRKSPSKVLSRSNIKVISQRQKSKSPRKVAVETQPVTSKSPKRTSSQTQRLNSAAVEPKAVSNVCRTATVATETECINPECNQDADDQEPRRIVPRMKLTPTKADKVARYNPDDYKQKTSVSNGSSSSLVSDDSSYFSDGCVDIILPKTTGSNKASVAGGSKVQVYDHSTRQRSCYNQPIGLVERINIRNEPNAVDAAREIIQCESIASNVMENRRLTAQKRGNDAILRERVRRDHDAMIKNLDHLTREERKLKASQPQCCTNEHMNQSRRKDNHDERQRQMDRAFTSILRETNQPGPSRADNLVERVITIPPRAVNDRGNNFPEATWENPPFSESSSAPDNVRQDNTEEMSREDILLEMLLKVERQRLLLLREYGADLPNNILNATMNPLFDNRQHDATKRSPVPPPPPPPSTAQTNTPPEIKIINMSSSDETFKKPKNVKKKAVKKIKSPPPPLTTIETAVQTSRLDEIGASKDKSTQVQITSHETRVSSPKNDTTGSLHYVEPIVTVITPHNDDSSSSNDYPVTGIIIEVDNKQVKVTPKKTKISSDKNSKRSSSKGRSKPRSLPASIAGSPVKKSVISAPSSRTGSPKKNENTCVARVRSPEKMADNRAKKNEAGPSRHARIVDSSIESSPTHSTPEAREVFTGKTYRIFKQPTIKKIREVRDASDTSTSYASLPASTPGNAQSERHQITPILEMLDSSANDSVRGSRRNISPVSTPGTPSPRVMNIPSNIPHPDRIGKILRFASFEENRGTENSTLPSSTQQSSLSDPSYSQNIERNSTKASRAPATRRSSKSSDHCSCTNPNCVLVHNDVADIRDFAAKTNNPEVLKKYEDLQNVCTERIASLTELIRRVRNESNGIDFSLISPADETSLMQLPPPREPRTDLQSVQRLVDSIEAIHSQLARTLKESQKIITSNIQPPVETPVNAELPTSSTSHETKSKGSTSTSTEETPVVVASTVKSKPKMISNELVKIDIDRLKRVRGPYTAMIMTTENVARIGDGNSRNHENTVGQLVKEIMEQTNSLDKSCERETSDNGNHEISLHRQRTPSPPQYLGNMKKQISPRKKNEEEVTRDIHRNVEPKNEDFVPILAGLPKIPRALPNVQPSLRPKPPPATSYRTEMGSPRHELSTIIEFDTPDTVNRSHGSTRSPSAKSRRVLQLASPTKSSKPGISPTEKDVDTQTVPVKSFANLDPMISGNVAGSIHKKLNKRDVASPELKFVSKGPVDRAESEKASKKSLLSQGSSTSVEDRASRKEDFTKVGDWFTGNVAERSVREIIERYEILQDKNDAPASSTLNPDFDNKNDKLTSTSSTSFSGLSGISEIGSTPTSELAKWASSSEEIESALKKMGLGWAIVTLKKTREASALSSSSNSDLTPMNTARRTKSPGKKQSNDCNTCGLLDFSDLSSISIKEASKSTERAVLMKARTSTPNIHNLNSSSGKSGSTITSSSGISLQDPSDNSLTAPNLSLNNKR